MSALLELGGIRAGYGRLEVLHGIDLAVPRGAIVALLGPNGAGKSTTFAVAAGLLAPTAGRLSLGGHDVGAWSPVDAARCGVRLVPESGGVFSGLTVAENLDVVRPTEVAAGAAGLTHDDVLQLLPVLRDRRSQVAGTLSGGEQQMLALARALVGGPQVLLVDELSTGLAPSVVQDLLDALGALPERGVTVLLSDQHADAVLDVAEICYVLRSGRCVFVGEPDELRAGSPARRLLGAA